MAVVDDIRTAIDSILSTAWDVTDGTAVPTTEDIKLQGGGRKLSVAMLYADLEDSTALVSHNRQMAAKVFKSFLDCCTRLIRHNAGHIRSFDGDRVMGVFVGDHKNTAATKTALQIKWAFDNVLRPKLLAQYEKLRDGTLTVGYSAGIANGDVLVVRAGIRGHNDLLWIGRVANIAAKLSDIRHQPYRSFLTEDVYKVILDEAKHNDGKDMWTKFKPLGEIGTFYGSEWGWKL